VHRRLWRAAQEGERRIEHGERAIAFIPARGAIVLGVDEQRDAADILRDADATIGSAQQQRSTEAPALHGSIDGEAAETEYGHVVTPQAFLRERRRPRIVERRV
jgi:hypothetical protein